MIVPLDRAGTAIETLAQTAKLDSCVPGFICAFIFEAGRPGMPLADARVAETFQHEAGWIWLHLNLADRRCAKWLAQTAGIDAAIAGDFSEPSPRQVISGKHGILLGHLADFRREFDSDPNEPAWLHFILSRRFLITGRSRAVQSAEQMRRLIARGTIFASP